MCLNDGALWLLRNGNTSRGGWLSRKRPLGSGGGICEKTSSASPFQAWYVSNGDQQPPKMQVSLAVAQSNCVSLSKPQRPSGDSLKETEDSCPANLGLQYYRFIACHFVSCACRKAENRILHLPQPSLERTHDLRQQSLDDGRTSIAYRPPRCTDRPRDNICNSLQFVEYCIVHNSTFVSSYNTSSRSIPSFWNGFE